MSATAINADECVLNLDLTYHACRIFDSASGAERLVFEVYWIESGANAAHAVFEQIEQQVAQGAGAGVAEYENAYQFGDERIAFSYSLDSLNGVGISIAFRSGEFIAVWSGFGLGDDPLAVFRDYWANSVQNPMLLDQNEEMNQLLPVERQLPGFSQSSESLLSAPEFFISIEQGTESSVTAAGNSHESLDDVVISEWDLQEANGITLAVVQIQNQSKEVVPKVLVVGTCMDANKTVVSTVAEELRNAEAGATYAVILTFPYEPSCRIYDVALAS